MISLTNTESGIRKLIEAEVNAAKIVETATVQYNGLDGGLHSFHDSTYYVEQTNKLNQYIEVMTFYKEVTAVVSNAEETKVIFSIRYKYKDDGFYSREDLIKYLGIFYTAKINTLF